MSGENWENVSILKRLQKKSAFSFCLKYLLKLRPGFILTSSTIFDSLVKKKKRAALPHKCRETAQGLRDKENKKLTSASKRSFTYFADLSTIMTHQHMVLELCERSLLGTVYMEWGTPVQWGWFLLFSRSGGHKTKETYLTRPRSPTQCKQGLNMKANISSMESHTDLIFCNEISLRVSINLTFVPKNGSTRRS